MELAKEKDLQEIFTFLRENLADCLYLYIDVKKYGLQNPNMTVWLERKGEEQRIHTVIMKYYDSLQMVSDAEDWDKGWLKELILKRRYNSVSGKASMISELASMLEQFYHTSYGVVFRLEEYRKFEDADMVEHASERDMREIAELICTDAFFRACYSTEILERQLRERLQSRMGRNVVIREDGKIISHIATYAEFEDIAITSGMITHPDYRNSIYGFLAESFLTNELLNEGKQVYTFVIDKPRKKLLTLMGAKICGEYGRMTYQRSSTERVGE